MSLRFESLNSHFTVAMTILVLFGTLVPSSVPCILGSLAGTLSGQSKKAGIKNIVAYKKKKTEEEKRDAWLLHLVS